jgi:putative transposase
MSRRSRLHVPGGVYYVVQRSNANQPIFTDAADYAIFEKLLATMLARCRARVHAFCWEVDAIHLALQVTDMPVGRLMQRLSSQYARRVHRRQGNGGHLFQQRYHSLLIDPDAYLLKLIRFLHFIPVRSGAVRDPNDYALSSQRAYLGMTQIPWLTTSVALRMLAQRPEQARYAYRRLMFETPALDEGAHFERGCDDDPRVLGDRKFMADIPRHMRVYRSSYSLDQVIDTVSCTLGVERSEVLSRSRQRRLSLARALITWYATERGVATLAEVARRLERDPSTLFVGVERYRTLRPELFNLTALPDNGPLLRPAPGSVPPGVNLPAGVTGVSGVAGTTGLASAMGSGGTMSSAGIAGSGSAMSSAGTLGSSGFTAASGVSASSGASGHSAGSGHPGNGVSSGGARGPSVSHASGVSHSSGLSASVVVEVPPGVEEPPRGVGVGPALLSGAWVTRRR